MVKDYLRKYGWGFWIFALLSISTFVTLMSRPVGGHYGIFTSAAQAILDRGDPYGTTFGWGVGPYFYSLTCGLSFFSFFNMFPMFWGLLLYVGSSWIFFLWGLFSLFKVLNDKFGFDVWQMPYKNFFWLFISSEMIGAILSSKIEIFMLGVIFFALKFLLVGRGILAGLLLGWITNWKFQPLPIVGLAFLVPLFVGRLRESLNFALGFVISLVVAYVLPIAWYGVDATMALYTRQNTLLSEFMRRDWLLFQNIYTFLFKNFGLSISFDWAQMFSVLVGVGFVVTLWAVRKKDLYRYAYPMAFALGAAFMNLFSPLSQSNAYILHTPLVLFVFFLIAQNGLQGKKVFAALFVAYFFISLAYSDLNPKPLRLYMYWQAYKPVGILVLLGLMGYSLSRTKKPASL